MSLTLPLVAWLFPRPVDRDRVATMHTTMSAARILSLPLMTTFVVVAAATGNGHWWWLGPLAVIMSVQLILRALAMRGHWPELLALASFLVGSAWLGVACSFTGGVDSPFLLWMVFTFVSAPTILSTRATIVTAACGLAAISAVAIGDWSAFLENPLSVLCVTFTMLVCLAVGLRVIDLDISQRESALRDPLTGVLNRTALNQRYTDLSAESASVTLLLFDLDHFKAVNDTYGHPLGDRILQAASATAVDQVRDADLVFRMGGEEFAILLPDVGRREALFIAERVRSAVHLLSVEGVRVTCSVGVATSDVRALDFEALYRHADAALYDAKEAGRNRICARLADPTLALTAER